jgi:hypothetical protein
MDVGSVRKKGDMEKEGEAGKITNRSEEREIREMKSMCKGRGEKE